MRTLINLTGAVGVYVLYLIVLVLCYGLDVFTQGGELPVWAITVLCSSLAAFLLWYVLADFVIRPNASDAAWLVTWFLLLFAVAIVVAVAIFKEMSGSESYWWLHLFFGLGAYWISSVFFSPEFARHRIWPSRYLHK